MLSFHATSIAAAVAIVGPFAGPFLNVPSAGEAVDAEPVDADAVDVEAADVEAVDVEAVGRDAVRVRGREELTLRRYELADLSVRAGQMSEDDWLRPGRLLTPALCSADYEVIGFDDFGTEDAYDIESYLYEVLGEEIEEEGVAMLRLSDQGLVVSASEEGHARVAERLEAVRALARADAQLMIGRWTVDSLPEGLIGGVVPTHAARSWAKQLAAEGEGSTRLVVANGHDNAVISSGSRADVPVNVHVEIAMQSAAADPEVRPLTVGVNGLVRAAPGNGGWHLALQMSSRDVSRAPSSDDVMIYAAIDNSVDSVGALAGSPRVRTTGIATDIFLADGEALVAIESGVNDATVTLAWAVGGDSSIVRRFGDTTVVELGAAVQPRVYGFRRSAESDRVGPGPIALDPEWERSNMFVCGIECDYIENVADLLTTVADHEIMRLEDLGDESASNAWEIAEHVVSRSYDIGPSHGRLVLGSWVPWIGEAGTFGPAFMERSAELVAALAAPRTNHSVRARLFDGDELLGDFLVPMRIGTRASLVDMNEQLAVPDLDVEVAEGSSVADPSVRPSLSGLCVTLELSGTDADPILDASGSWQLERLARSHFEHRLMSTLHTIECEGQIFDGARAIGAAPGVWGDTSGSGVRLEVELVR